MESCCVNVQPGLQHESEERKGVNIGLSRSEKEKDRAREACLNSPVQSKVKCALLPRGTNT